MRLQLNDIFAGETAWTGEIQNNPIVQHLTALGTEWTMRSVAGFQDGNAAHTCGDVMGQRTGETDDPDTSGSLAAGDRDDGVATR